jgi:hypothetical protein
MTIKYKYEIFECKEENGNIYFKTYVSIYVNDHGVRHSQEILKNFYCLKDAEIFLEEIKNGERDIYGNYSKKLVSEMIIEEEG